MTLLPTAIEAARQRAPISALRANGTRSLLATSAGCRSPGALADHPESQRFGDVSAIAGACASARRACRGRCWWVPAADARASFDRRHVPPRQEARRRETALVYPDHFGVRLRLVEERPRRGGVLRRDPRLAVQHDVIVAVAVIDLGLEDPPLAHNVAPPPRISSSLLPLNMLADDFYPARGRARNQAFVGHVPSISGSLLAARFSVRGSRFRPRFAGSNCERRSERRH